MANAASFGAVIASLVALNVSQLHPSAPVRRARGQLRQGLAYARTVPEILAPVAMMALIGTLTYEYEVSLPLFGRGALHGGPTTYSALFAAFGLGSVIGGVYCTRHPKTGVPRMIRAALVYAAAMLATALTTQTYAAVALLTVVGFASITFLTTGNSTVQLAGPARHARPHDRPVVNRVRRQHPDRRHYHRRDRRRPSPCSRSSSGQPPAARPQSPAPPSSSTLAPQPARCPDPGSA